MGALDAVFPSQKASVNGSDAATPVQPGSHVGKDMRHVCMVVEVMNTEACDERDCKYAFTTRHVFIYFKERCARDTVA